MKTSSCVDYEEALRNERGDGDADLEQENLVTADVDEDDDDAADEETVLKEAEDEFANQKNPETAAEINEFIKKNFRLIHRLLRPYRGLYRQDSDSYKDLVQEASIGFLKGIQTFDAGRGVKLTTYAYTCAKNEVKMYLRRSCAKSRTATVISIDATFDADDDGDNLLNRDLEAMDPLRAAVDMDERVHTQIIVDAAMKIIREEMTPVQQTVIRRHLEGVPQSQTAKELHTSQSEISKILKNAFCELRLKMEERGYVMDD